jgi:hypothetical protein
LISGCTPVAASMASFKASRLFWISLVRLMAPNCLPASLGLMGPAKNY